MDQKVLLSSGGMDSFLLAHERELRGAIHVFVNLRQKYVDKERVAAMAVAKMAGAQFVEMKTLNMGAYEHATGIIPFRNAELILCCAQHGNHIYLGVIADEINSDKSVEFCDAMANVLNISHRPQYWTEGKRFEIRTPFRNDTKSALLARYLRNGGTWDNILQSVSCYDAGSKHCGRCASCFKRWVAMINVTTMNEWQEWGFVADPFEWKPASEWAKKFADYADGRAAEIESALFYAQL